MSQLLGTNMLDASLQLLHLPLKTPLGIAFRLFQLLGQLGIIGFLFFRLLFFRLRIFGLGFFRLLVFRLFILRRCFFLLRFRRGRL